MAYQVCYQKLSELSALVQSHGTFVLIFLYFKHGVFSCGNYCKFVRNSRSLENFIDTNHYKKVVPESRFLGSCCRNGGATNVCRYHCSDVKNGVDWKQRLCLILSKHSGCILFLIFSPLLRLASKHNSHCSRQTSRYFIASAISRTCYCETYQCYIGITMVNKWWRRRHVHLISYDK